MSWEDRLRNFFYLAPSGTLHQLKFTEVERARGKKAPVSEFPNQDQGAVQDLGLTTPRFPVSGFIDGIDYDEESDRFWEALQEKGPGELRHPRYGNIKVLPVSIAQREDFINGRGRATFTIDFVQAVETQFEYPRKGTYTGAVSRSVDGAADSIAASVSGVEITEPGQLEALKDNVLGAVDAVTDAVNGITGAVDQIGQQINDQINEITNTIDDLVESPIALANSLLTLYRLPADVAASVKDKISGYRSMFENIAAAAVATTERYGAAFGLLGTADCNSVAIAAAEASTTGTTETRSDATEAAEEMAALVDDLQTTIDTLGANEYASTQASRQAVTDALIALIESQLELPAEKLYVTPRDMTPYEIAYELYGPDADLETMTDRIIDYNRLEGGQIIEVASGTEVYWYE